jgi:tRNA pseudouridine32 synthase/23S rRNA pseudouridine746 synthase
MSSDPVISASGFCAACGTVHSLGEGNSRKYALELMRQLEEFKRIDWVGTAVPAVRGRLGDASLPSKFSTDYLLGEARGQMFGVLECEDRSGKTVILKAFSCQYDGEWLVDGWVPPVIDPKQFYDLIAEPDRQINIRTRALKAMEKSDPEYKTLSDERKALSQQLMKEIHALYHLTNFHGETRPLTEIIPGNIPMGVGECCAPKLLNYAALNGLKPLGLSEFYWGKENKSGTRKHGEFYPACAEKCQPILGFMLCGIKERNNGLLDYRITGRTTSSPIHQSSIPIIHADNDVVVIIKPSGLLSVPGKGEENQDCVVSRIKVLYPGCIEQPAVHRLDMDTSGLMVLALTADAQRELSRQFHDRETEKHYIALLDGVVTGDEGTIELPFRLDVETRPYQIYDPVNGKTGITHWKVLSTSNKKTRVKFIPVTGRTHQLRVHAASEHGLGIPIAGDRLYGSGTAPGQLKLHASFLSFTHPRTGERLEFRSEPDF